MNENPERKGQLQQLIAARRTARPTMSRIQEIGVFEELARGETREMTVINYTAFAGRYRSLLTAIHMNAEIGDGHQQIGHPDVFHLPPGIKDRAASDDEIIAIFLQRGGGVQNTEQKKQRMSGELNSMSLLPGL